MLEPDEVVDIVRDLWKRHQDELPFLDRVYGYARGELGVPDVPDGAGDELKELARLSVKNVLSLVEDSFTQSLSVIGFRTSEQTDDAPAWALWQAQQMDARQAEVHRPAIRYGASYLIVEDGGDGPVFRPRSPRQVFAVYADPQIDEWPIYALESWIDYSEAKPRRRGVLFDGELAYPVEMGNVQKRIPGEKGAAATSKLRAPTVTVVEDPRTHGGNGLCPVVRFVNERDAEDLVQGEIHPLIGQQRAINAVNFDRLSVSRFGAFPQKLIIGWSATRDEAIKASVSRILTFDDPEVKHGAFPSAAIGPYNELILEMMEHVANTAQIPTRDVTGKMANLSPDAIAAADAMQQRKLNSKKESFGESWEQALSLAAGMAGLEFDSAAEVLWRNTEIQSFSGMVDGIQKLTTSGVNIVDLIDDIPNWSEQRKQAAKNRLAGNSEVIAAIERLAAGARDATGS